VSNKPYKETEGEKNVTNLINFYVYYLNSKIENITNAFYFLTELIKKA
jgi:hypothetical protein